LSSHTSTVAVLILVSLITAGVFIWWLAPRELSNKAGEFSGELAFKHVEDQMVFGPRPTGSDANRKTGDYILAELERLGWQTDTQEFTYRSTVVRNIIGKAGLGLGSVIIIGAHYDTRMRADRDSTNPTAAVPGANDGASGVAVLLELARVLDIKAVRSEIWLTFFDAEDNGGIDGWEWIVGSTYMAEHLTVMPQSMILVDMVGDTDQRMYMDRNSDLGLSKRLFQIAHDLGYGQHFIPVPKYAMLDDHTPFARLGIRAVDLIDFDYPHWHTTADTIDKVSPSSLERVGRTIETFIEHYATYDLLLRLVSQRTAPFLIT